MEELPSSVNFENTVPRHFPRVVCARLATLVAGVLLSVTVLAAGGQAPAAESLSGRLAFVEPALRRIAVIADGEVRLSELFVADDSELRQGDRELTLEELVIQVGRRVTVRYRVEGDRRIADSVIVAPEG
jgi:hypothetical protein